MPYALDAELLEVVAKMRAAGAGMRQPTARDDWTTLRTRGDEGMAAAEAALPALESVSRTDHHTISHDGAEVLLRWYAPEGHDVFGAGPAVIYLHGGGMVAGSVALFDRWVAAYVAESGVPLLAVDYRRAPDHPHPTPVEDSYAGLAWLAVNAEALGADASRIALMGDSAGGGLAAATALLARDRGLPVAKQILIYPMLDDRTTEPDPALVPFAFFTYDENYTGWHALLGEAVGGPDVPGYAAPARAQDLTGLAPAYIEVGELDIFRDETIEYALRLAATGISVELHVHPGCPHGFDRLAPQADVARRSRADRLRALTSF
ncbi:alpha/beta hydrolase [Streptomyces sp. NPDC006355]|uniref:alpha/beta hydrolase n=1 Tax=Streptomyces sp. NPDC006355 TaxID=3156758 RepID=UPI0033BD8DA6